MCMKKYDLDSCLKQYDKNYMSSIRSNNSNDQKL